MSLSDLDRFSSLIAEGNGAGVPAAAWVLLAAVAIVLLRTATSRRPTTPPEGPCADGASVPERDALPAEDLDRLERALPLAVLFVGGAHRLERHSLRSFRDLYARQYSQILFVSVGLVDYAWMDSAAGRGGSLAGGGDLKRLLQSTRKALDPCIAAAHAMGLKADCRVAVSVDEAGELERLAVDVAKRYSQSLFFISKIVWSRKSLWRRILHAETADVLRGRLESRGLPVTVLPVVVPGSA